MHFLFVYFPQPPSRDQQSASFQWNCLYEESVQDSVPILTHTQKCASISCISLLTSVPVISKFLTPGWATWSGSVCLRGALHEKFLWSQRGIRVISISLALTQQSRSTCASVLTGLGDVSMYWSAGLNTLKCGSLLKCPPTIQPSAADSVSQCCKESVINYINGMILEISFLQHFVSLLKDGGGGGGGMTTDLDLLDFFLMSRKMSWFLNRKKINLCAVELIHTLPAV